mmetsp:Transcript_57926/g.102916  ORF Transcript_57926/g.102916 Transcript_57926/m.102916 type:complete len:242 (-) Transcript_57926:3285-4010(-)
MDHPTMACKAMGAQRWHCSLCNASSIVSSNGDFDPFTFPSIMRFTFNLDGACSHRLVQHDFLRDLIDQREMQVCQRELCDDFNLIVGLQKSHNDWTRRFPMGVRVCGSGLCPDRHLTRLVLFYDAPARRWGSNPVLELKFFDVVLRPHCRYVIRNSLRLSHVDCSKIGVEVLPFQAAGLIFSCRAVAVADAVHVLLFDFNWPPPDVIGVGLCRSCFRLLAVDHFTVLARVNSTTSCEVVHD